MGEKTGITWCHHTFNPWWGCTNVSPGCDFCYAEALAARFGFEWGKGAARRVFPHDKHWNEPRRWHEAAVKAGVRRRVFCASMADVFDVDAPASELPRLWTLIRQTPALDWLLLTKRPQRIAKTLPADLHGAPNVWLGTSIETMDYAWRRDALVATPAVVHFVSAEPLLGPLEDLDLGDIEWLITGGESGGPTERRLVEIGGGDEWVPSYRALDWVRALRDRCADAGVAFFHKQWGGPRSFSAGHYLDGYEHHEFPR